MQKNTTASHLSGRYGCIIMASGIGRRFGSNKLLTEFRGKPLISYILEASDTPLFARRIVVTRHEEIAQLCAQHGIECLLHHLPGQNDTIRLGLETFPGNYKGLPASDSIIGNQAVESLPDCNQTAICRDQLSDLHFNGHSTEYTGCCFCTSDQPLLSKSSIERLIRTADAHPDMICRCASDGQMGNPVIFPAEFFPELMKLPYDKGGGWLIRQYQDRVLPVAVQDCRELEDIDTAADLERIRQI